MKKFNQKGFSAVEVLVVIVVVGLIGTVGWLVYDRQQTKDDASQSQTTNTEPNNTGSTVEDEETEAKEDAPKYSLTKKLTSLNKKFSLYVPDGWTFTNDTKLDYAYARESGMNYSKGTAATINNEYGHRGGGYTGTSFGVQFSNDSQSNYYSASEPDGTLKLNNGKVAKRYKYVSTGTEDGMQKGSLSYGYLVSAEPGSIILTYLVNKGDTNQRELVEAAIKTLEY